MDTLTQNLLMCLLEPLFVPDLSRMTPVNPYPVNPYPIYFRFILIFSYLLLCISSAALLRFSLPKLSVPFPSTPCVPLE
jgi:hypothetical protein